MGLRTRQRRLKKIKKEPQMIPTIRVATVVYCEGCRLPSQNAKSKNRLEKQVTSTLSILSGSQGSGVHARKNYDYLGVPQQQPSRLLSLILDLFHYYWCNLHLLSV